ncbi:hypothetical protein Pmani_028028 [Petrolisthes manimaculis]|uniref:Helitron helicase-like domain-containing protein n=1 Tax=Petrolisthes manimaculis TaxID=1843537 RepID=A0AAE1P2I1_9EUCA|nr:hypothetical protein Pmani_028028 [Petrolisthes manimaculis]
MADNPIIRLQRHRHFWWWVTKVKKLNRDILQDKALNNSLRAEHARAFPDLYGSVVRLVIDVKESIHQFHRNVLQFNQSLKGGDPEYCDAKFDVLKLFDGEIEAERSAGFLKHYQAKRKHFAKNGGSYDHRAFQMHYLDQAYSKYKRDHRPINKYIKRQLAKRLKIEGVACRKEERAHRKILRELEKVEIKRKKTIIMRAQNTLRDGGSTDQLEPEERLALAEEREKRHLINVRDTIDDVEVDARAMARLPGATRKGVKRHYMGKIGDFNCKLCRALLWNSEKHSLCCLSGQIRRTEISEIGGLKALYNGTSELSERFLKGISGFNMFFSFTSFATSSKLENSSEASMCFKIKGRIYHRLATLDPELMLKDTTTEDFVKGNDKGTVGRGAKAAALNRIIQGLPNNNGQEVNEKEKGVFQDKQKGYLDLYFHFERDQEIKLRTQSVTRMSHANIGNKSDTKEKAVTMRRRQREETEIKMSITLKSSEGLNTREHKGVYHLPTSSSQVGAIVNLDSDTDHLSIAVRSPKPDSKYRIFILNHHNYFYDGFQYPLIIPNGDIGYQYQLRAGARLYGRARKNKSLSPCMIYASLYMERKDQFNYITKSRMLFQQYAVDNYVKVETARLAYIRLNQRELRKERSDILLGDSVGDKSSSGQRIIIPASFVGGPRYMKQRQQDALAFVSQYGSPDFFITFTFNPKWVEIGEAMSKEKQEDYLSEDTAIEGEEMDIQSSVFNGMRSSNSR